MSIFRKYTRYFPRACSSKDFEIGSPFINNNGMYVDGLDLTGIVPPNAIAVHFEVFVLGGLGSFAWFWANQTTKLYNRIRPSSIMANGAEICGHYIINIDSDRLMDYRMDISAEPAANCDVTVLGWFV